MSWNKMIFCLSCYGTHVSIIESLYIFLIDIIFWIDLDAPDVDVLTEEPQDAGEPKIDDTWSPYESKMVSRLFDPPTDD